MVRAGDVPLLAVDRIAALCAPRGRLDGHVRAGAALGDRVTLFPRAAHERQDELLDLLLGAGLEHPALGFGETPAERVRDAAQLFPDGDLVHDPRLPAAARPGHVHGAEAELDRELLVPLLDFRREAALVQFRLDFKGNQLFGRELEGAIAPVPGCCVERDLHGSSLASPLPAGGNAAGTRPPGRTA